VFIRRRRARFAAINAAYAKYFKTPYPASPTVAVSAPPVGVNVEIDEALDR
jgi:enamine deaminase RidA (YjgF/YER057c/UK114 family)